MTKSEIRQAKLRSALADITAGKTIAAAELRKLLTEAEYARFLDDWEQQGQLRKDLRDKPTEIIEYEKRLKKLNFTYAKAEGLSHRGKAGAKEMYWKADTYGERVLEYIGEFIAGHGHLEMWFDRPVRFNSTNVPGLTPCAMPQIVTSRSLNNRSNGMLPMMKSKNDAKREAIEFALQDLEAPSVEKSDVDKAMAKNAALRKRLGKHLD